MRIPPFDTADVFEIDGVRMMVDDRWGRGRWAFVGWNLDGEPIVWVRRCITLSEARGAAVEHRGVVRRWKRDIAIESARPVPRGTVAA